MLKLAVSASEQGLRLLSFLRNRINPKYSNKAIKRSIDHGWCCIHGKVERFSSYKVKEHDQVTFDLRSLDEKKRGDQSLAVLFEDEDLLVCNKPSGLICHPSYIPYCLVHRLDKETSGVLLLAKNRTMQQNLEKLFYLRQVEKKYFAVVLGMVRKESGSITSYLEKKAVYDGQTIWGSSKGNRGNKAITSWKCSESNNLYSLLECTPQTGRTHQLRVHLKEMGHPIMGDKQYAPRAHFPMRTHRFLLHSIHIRFKHPRTKEIVQVDSSIPNDIMEHLNQECNDASFHL